MALLLPCGDTSVSSYYYHFALKAPTLHKWYITSKRRVSIVKVYNLGSSYLLDLYIFIYLSCTYLFECNRIPLSNIFSNQLESNFHKHCIQWFLLSFSCRRSQILPTWNVELKAMNSLINANKLSIRLCLIPIKYM